MTETLSLTVLRRGALAMTVVIALVLLAIAPATPQGGARVFLTDVNGAIGVATTRQFERAIAHASKNNGTALIVRLDTPGGLVSSTRELIKQMIASPVPIVVYVAPSGARAASAGTFIVYASHVAAMAPGTNLGAATPVSIGGVPGLPSPGKNEKKNDKNSQNKSAMEQKAINDVVALLRSLAQLRGRNVDFAEKAVREAATMTGPEAQKAGVVDILAGSVDDLLTQMDGRKVTVAGAERTLATKGAQVETLEPDWRTKLLATISNPNVAFLLLMIGFYGLVLEFWNPGTFIPGTVGGISLILALTALSALPVHYGSLALLILGLGLMIGEAFTPGIGILGLGGVVAFVVGAIFLFEGADADIEIAVSLPLIIGMTALTAGIVFGIIGAAVKAHKRKATTGAEQIVGATGKVVTWNDKHGQVHLLGETWSARAEAPFQPGDAVRVVGRDGLTLIVER